MARPPVPMPGPIVVGDPGTFVVPDPGQVLLAAQPFSGAFKVRRPRDGLVVDIVLHDVMRVPGARVVTSRLDGVSRIILVLPPQHIGEGFVTVGPGGMIAADKIIGPIAAGLAGITRLAFKLPAGKTLDLTADALLNECRTLAPAVNINGSPGWPVPSRPETGGTFIEAPYKLALTPNTNAGFVHAAAVPASSARAALWHTRLVPFRGDARIPGRGAFRPAPARGFLGPAAQLTGVTVLLGGSEDAALGGLSVEQRKDIVGLTGGPNVGTYAGVRPAQARRLVLTPLGASFDFAGHWPDSEVDVIGWLHRAALGRDSFVRVVSQGYLAPFGHRAVLIKVTERVAHKQGAGKGWIAVLRQQSWVVVTEPRRDMKGALSDAEERRFPFVDVELLTLITPMQPKNPVMPLWLRTGPTSNLALPFDIVATDAAGRRARFRLPLLFATGGTNGTTAKLLASYNAKQPGEPARAVRDADLGSAPVALAAADRANSTLAVQHLEFELAPCDSPGPARRFPFAPRLKTVTAAIPGGEEFDGGRKTGVFQFENDYAATGLKSAGVFLAAAAGTLPTKLFEPAGGGDTQVTGGLLTPTLTVGGISTKLGAFGGTAAAVAQGSFNAADMFGGMKLLGVIPLSDILPAPLLENAPKLLRTVDSGSITTSFKMVRDDVASLDKAGSPLYFRADASVFTLDSQVTVNTAGGGGSKLSASLTDFAIGFRLQLPDANKTVIAGIELNFAALSLGIVPGAKPDLRLDFAKPAIRFTGLLGFVQQLLDVLPLSAFSDPPEIDIGPGGVTAGYSLALPPIPIGALILSNIGFGAVFKLPFVGGKPSLMLSFASRERPFGILVAIIGGGGYFAVEMDTGGLVALEGTLEAQAGIALNLGMAAGAVSVRLGIYYRYVLKPAPGQPGLTLEAFFEVHGEMSVLGLISVSITLHIGLVAKKSGPRTDLYGTARIAVEIEFCFFSKTVQVECTRQFAGSNADPGFAEVFPSPQVWLEQYVQAFN